MAKITAWLLLALWLTACLSQPPELPIRSLTPSQGKTLLKNQWRLTEVVYKGVQGEFDSIDPVLATFHANELSIHACNAASMFFKTATDPSKEYQLISGASTAMTCDNGGTEQEYFIVRALAETYDYELIGDTLVLFGEKARLTFVIDNETTKPPDWT